MAPHRGAVVAAVAFVHYSVDHSASMLIRSAKRAGPIAGELAATIVLRARKAALPGSHWHVDPAAILPSDASGAD